MDLSQIRNISDVNMSQIFHLREEAEAEYRQCPLVQLALDECTVTLTLGLERSNFHACMACFNTLLQLSNSHPPHSYLCHLQRKSQLPICGKENVSPHIVGHWDHFCNKLLCWRTEPSSWAQLQFCKRLLILQYTQTSNEVYCTSWDPFQTRDTTTHCALT